MERVVVRLARQLGLLGWDASVAFALDERSDLLVPWASDQGVKSEASAAVRTVDDSRSFADIAALTRLVRRLRPDVVNLHYPGAHVSAKDVLSVRFASRAACVVNVHLPVPWSEAGWKKKILTSVAVRWGGDVVAHSNSLRAVLVAAGIPLSRIHLIHNGGQLPTEYFAKNAARSALGIPEQAYVVGCLARLAPIKRQADLIEAVASMAVKAPSVFLVMAGDGPDRAELEEFAARQLPGRHLFLGELTGAPDEFFSAIDVFALSSTREGMPMVCIEAALRGVPVVGTDVGGTSEIVLHGRTGLLVPPRAPADLASALLSLHVQPNLRSELGVAAEKWARGEFSEEAMGARYHALFSRRIRRR